MDAGEKIAVIDLLRFEDDPQDMSVISGALRADPREMRRKRHVVAPDNLDVVLYCGSENSFVSARVAVMLRKNGIRRIRVLAGGRAAWKALDFPMSSNPADPRAELERLGVDVYPPWSPPQAKAPTASG
jgi:rhodanese-related sulfurtransferase